jgi:hypothetical protein
MQTTLNAHFWTVFVLLVTGGGLAAAALTLLCDTALDRLRRRRSQHSPPFAPSGRPSDADRRFTTRLTTGHLGHDRRNVTVRR